MERLEPVRLVPQERCASDQGRDRAEKFMDEDLPVPPLVPRERVQHRTAERGIPEPREETVEAARSIPCEQTSTTASCRAYGGQVYSTN